MVRFSTQQSHIEGGILLICIKVFSQAQSFVGFCTWAPVMVSLKTITGASPPARGQVFMDGSR